mmetsp:Transcript_2954/g.8076  ORF Transcript_2954/g.8076 Transcript_2954/m.8076 type:complete len:491 (-) Transcript_2954:1966-3438(-)
MAKDQQLRSRKEEEERRAEIETQSVIESDALRPHLGVDQILFQLRSSESEREFERTDRIVHNAPTRSRSRHRGSSPSPPPPPMHEEAVHIFPETAKWCLKALGNLTKPSNHDATAAHVLIKSGIYSLVVQYITTTVAPRASTEEATVDSSIATPDSDSGASRYYYQIDSNFLSASYGGVYVRNVAANDRSGEDCDHSHRSSASTNSPCLWNSGSLQDAALFIVFNLAASSRSREYMNEPNTVEALSMIAESPRNVAKSQNRCHRIGMEQQQVVSFQCLKARMALSYLVGSQGHFGQTKLRSSASTVLANRNDSSLIMTRSDVQLFVELVANTINGRGKDGICGAGKYLPGTFDLKSVIFSLRCLLTHTTNQERIAKLVGANINSLLINSLAQYTLEPSASVLDSESAEHAVFSLYLLSNHSLEKTPFLPETYAPNSTTVGDEDDGLAAKVLFSYLSLSQIPPAARHAARQLLLRIKYLKFENNHLLVRWC